MWSVVQQARGEVLIRQDRIGKNSEEWAARVFPPLPERQKPARRARPWWARLAAAWKARRLNRSTPVLPGKKSIPTGETMGEVV